MSAVEHKFRILVIDDVSHFLYHEDGRIETLSDSQVHHFKKLLGLRTNIPSEFPKDSELGSATDPTVNPSITQDQPEAFEEVATDDENEQSAFHDDADTQDEMPHLTSGMWETLNLLVVRGLAMTIKQIKRRSRLSPSTIGNYLDILVGMRLVQRKRSVGHWVPHRYFATPAGKTLIKEHWSNPATEKAFQQPDPLPTEEESPIPSFTGYGNGVDRSEHYSAGMWEILTVLCDRGTAMTQKQLCRRTSLAFSSHGKYLDILTHAGLVSRRRCTKSLHRTYRYFATDAGHEFYQTKSQEIRQDQD